jgi:hypothetical protein
VSAHEELRDTIAALALGVLDQRESDAARAHLAECEACRREYAELRPVANLVGLSAQASPAELDELSSQRMRSALRAAIAPAPAAPAPPARKRSTLIAYLIAAAAIVIAALTSLNGAALQSQHALDSERIAELQKQLNAKERASEYDRAALADIFSRDSVRYPVNGGEVVRHGDRLYLAMWALPAPQRGHVYQAWLKEAGAAGMTPSVTFVPNAKGFAILRVPAAASKVDIVAVSVEPEGGSKAPTTTPAFVQKLGPNV